MGNQIRPPRGIVPPIPTLLDGRQLDEGGQRELVQNLRTAGVDGVLALGTAGEGPVLPDGIRAAAITASVKAIEGLPVIVGCSGQTADHVVDQAQMAADLGATAVLAMPPFFFSLSQDSIIRYLTDVADRSLLPVVLYHIPGMTGNSLEVPTVEQLSQHPNIVGIKDSGGDFIRFLRLQRTFDSERFSVFQGVAALVGPSLLAGCGNTMCTVTAIMPGPEMELRSAIGRADLETIGKLMHHISAVTELFRLPPYPLPANIKAVASLLGFGTGRPHDGAVNPDPDHLARLSGGLGRLGLLAGEENP